MGCNHSYSIAELMDYVGVGISNKNNLCILVSSFRMDFHDQPIVLPSDEFICNICCRTLDHGSKMGNGDTTLVRKC